MKPTRKLVPGTGKRFRLNKKDFRRIPAKDRSTVRLGVAKLSRQSMNRLTQLVKSSNLEEKLGKLVEVNGKRYVLNGFRLANESSWSLRFPDGKVMRTSIKPENVTLLFFSSPNRPNQLYQVFLEGKRFTLVESKPFNSPSNRWKPPPSTMTVFTGTTLIWTK